MYLVGYYPNSPYEWVQTYDVSVSKDHYNYFEHMYKMRFNEEVKKDEIVTLHDAFWLLVEANSIREAIDIFWTKLGENDEQYKRD